MEREEMNWRSVAHRGRASIQGIDGRQVRPQFSSRILDCRDRLAYECPLLLLDRFRLMLIFGARGDHQPQPGGERAQPGRFVSRLAALFMSLDAFFIGIIQVLVYAGAVMVLFLFIIMLLDLRAEDGAGSTCRLRRRLARRSSFFAQLYLVIGHLRRAASFPACRPRRRRCA
jgi:hypothetical protein